jgi:nucleotidyltransferase substrate binding protein (TIGR01987 family)
MQDIRWEQRFQNFDRAVVLLREAMEHGLDKLSDLEKEGAVHRFELALELAWKILKDYLEYAGTAVKPVTPRSVIKEAFTAQILTDGQVWIDMLNHRNLLSHTYDESTYEEAVLAIRDRYLPAIIELHRWLKEEAAK